METDGPVIIQLRIRMAGAEASVLLLVQSSFSLQGSGQSQRSCDCLSRETGTMVPSNKPTATCISALRHRGGRNPKLSTKNIDFCLVYQLPGIQNWMSPHVLPQWEFLLQHNSSFPSKTEGTPTTVLWHSRLNKEPVSDSSIGWKDLILHFSQHQTRCLPKQKTKELRELKLLTCCHVF